MAKIVKSAKADIFLRDTDTQSLFNNSGVLSFKYYHEWNDAYNSTTDETVQIDGETYDEATNSYKPNCPEGFSPVFNGRQSALWDNLSSCFSDKVKEMYKSMRSNGLAYREMLGKYKEFWRYWCENLYNADAFGYANTDNFTKAYGDKLQLMDYFLSKRQRYLDSKFTCGDSTSNNLMLRLYEQGKGFAIMYYQAIYSSVAWGSKVDTQRNIKPGTYSYIPFGLTGLQDATINVYDADLITELSTYTKSVSGNYAISGLEGLGDFKFDLNMGLLQRLTKFVMAYTKSKPNTKEKGESFDLSNMRMLKQVIVTNVQNLTKSIVLSSDLIEEIDFTGTPISGVSTPPTDALTKLTLPSSITSLHLVGYTNLSTSGLKVESYANIKTLDFEDCPQLKSLDIVTTCYSAGAPLDDVTIKGVDWKLDSLDLLLYLAKKGAKLQGKITIADTVRVSFEQKRAFLQAWGNIDLETNSLYISYNKVAITSVKIQGGTYLDEKGKDYSLSVVPNPINGNDFVSVTWSISQNDYATINPKTGVISVSKVGTEEEAPTATVTVDVELSDGRVMTSNELTVHFFNRAMQVGDVVYADGTYSPNTEIDETKTIVAVCFYINPDDPTDRRGVAPKPIFEKDRGTFSNCWGLEDATYPGVTLKDDPDYEVYLVSGIRNFTNGDVQGAIAYNGFEEFPQDVLDFEKGQKVPIGQYQTARIVAHANKILSDSNINMEIPTASAKETEFAAAKRLTANHTDKNGEWNPYLSMYYYPNAYLCYTYVPSIQKGEVLADKFKGHKWYLWGVDDANEFIKNIDLFRELDKKYIFKLLLSITTSTQYNSYTCYQCEVNKNNAKISWESKRYTRYEYPCVRL